MQDKNNTDQLGTVRNTGDDAKTLPDHNADEQQPSKNRDLFNIVSEIEMLKQIKDIQDELLIMRTLIADQLALINQLRDTIETTTSIFKARRTVIYQKEKVEKMDKHARHTHQAV